MRKNSASTFAASVPCPFAKSSTNFSTPSERVGQPLDRFFSAGFAVFAFNVICSRDLQERREACARRADGRPDRSRGDLPDPVRVDGQLLAEDAAEALHGGPHDLPVQRERIYDSADIVDQLGFLP